jgi:hypothetical protein
MCFKNNNVPCPQELNCKECYEKSFASHQKSKYWSDKNGKDVKPWQFKKHSHKKFWFKCDKSEHEFESKLNHISNGSWCPYPCCYSNKLCSNNTCNICFEASFASSPKVYHWSDKNILKPRDVFKNTHVKFWFSCNKSNHEFDISLDNLLKNKWCPYPCCADKKLCSDDSCNICFDASFISSPKAIYWSDKNELAPRDVLKASGHKFLFICEANHEFEASLSHITTNWSWCPKCCIRQNQKECQQIIEQLTEKLFKQIRPVFLNGLELDGYNEELQLAYEYNGEQHYEYIPFFHRAGLSGLVKQKERDKLKEELCIKNGIYLIIIPYWISDKRSLINEEYQKYLFLNSFKI